MRRLLAILLAVLGGALAPLGLLAWDVREVLFDTERWVETTAPVLEDEQARSTLSVVLVDGVVAAFECEGGMPARLPATRLGASARARAARQLETVLASRRAVRAWSSLNREAHAGFVRATRTDGAGIDNRLLESAELLEIAAVVVTGIALAGADEDAPASGDGCGEGGVVEVVDPGAMRAAAGIARGLHVAHWLPLALVVASLALFVLAMLLARVSSVALAWWGFGAVAAAGVAWWGLDAGLSLLVDGIRGEAPRELAARLLELAFEPARAHQVVAGACAGVVCGAAFAVALLSRGGASG